MTDAEAELATYNTADRTYVTFCLSYMYGYPF